MTTALQLSERPAIEYPDSDGLPMAENTLQFRWIVTIMGGLDALFLNDPNVFVAGDLLWYPVEGEPTIRMGPDVLVAFSRPKGDRARTSSGRKVACHPRSFLRSSRPATGPAKWTVSFSFTSSTALRNTTSTTRTMGRWKAGGAGGSSGKDRRDGGLRQPSAWYPFRSGRGSRQPQDLRPRRNAVSDFYGVGQEEQDRAAACRRRTPTGRAFGRALRELGIEPD